MLIHYFAECIRELGDVAQGLGWKRLFLFFFAEELVHITQGLQFVATVWFPHSASRSCTASIVACKVCVVYCRVHQGAGASRAHGL